MEDTVSCLGFLEGILLEVRNLDRDRRRNVQKKEGTECSLLAFALCARFGYIVVGLCL